LSAKSHASTLGTSALQNQATLPLPASPQRQTPVQMPTPGTLASQGSAGGATASSARPLQSSSRPLHASAARVWAVQPTQPLAASHVSCPKQVPTVFVSAHVRS
jgi:hypothetical protein